MTKSDRLWAEIVELPARIFGFREFEIVNHPSSQVRLSKNYPDSMRVYIVKADNGQCEILMADTKDPGLQEPVFIG